MTPRARPGPHGPAASLRCWFMWCLIAGSAPAAVFAAGPQETLAATVDAVIATVSDDSLNEDSKRRQVLAIISKHFDFRAMSNRVLATNWTTASKAQRARITALFRELLSNTYWHKIAGYRGEQVEYVAERIRDGNLATVHTLIKTATADIPVDYKLYLRGEEWFAYDVVIEQVSLVRNYRSSFQDIVHAEGIDGLIRKLELKVAETSSAE